MPAPQTGTVPRQAKPLRVPVWRVTAVVPVHNRPGDVARAVRAILDQDLAGPPGGIGLDIVVVDNASDVPIDPRAWDARVHVVRLDSNAGGSGGFNAGLREVVGRESPTSPDADLVWLVDSDAEPLPGALAALVSALDRHPELAGVGSALVDPITREVYEAGGRIAPRHAELVIDPPEGWSERETIDREYLAACSLLVRRRAIEIAGPLPDVFLAYDDVGWCVRLRERTGALLAGVPASRVLHPHPDKMRLGARYYASRNAFSLIAHLGLGPRARLRRALREAARACAQTLVGRNDLARAHVLGLRHALDPARRSGRGAPPPVRAARPLSELTSILASARRVTIDERALDDLAPAERANVEAALPASARRIERSASAWRAWTVRATRGGTSIISARGRPRDLLGGRTRVAIASNAFTIDGRGSVARLARAFRVAASAFPAVARLALRGGGEVAPARTPSSSSPAGAPAPALTIVVLSYNRRDALLATLESLRANPDAAGAEVIVVDNASTDDSVRSARSAGARVVALDRNLGVAGFNVGVWLARGEFALVLDDDARPRPGALRSALDALARDPLAAGVALHPVHPSGRSEWPFARGASDRFPVMGCANLVRVRDWRDALGYEPGFFLYRNDADLAMTFLDRGRRVRFDPAWMVEHDSEGIGRKSPRWFELATRNWIWVARRHARASAWSPKGWASLALGIALGLGRAHALARLSPRLHARVLAGAFEGLLRRPPRAPGDPSSPGAGYAEFLRLRLRRRAR